MNHESLFSSDYAEPLFLGSCQSSGKAGIDEAKEFIRVAREKSKFPAGAYIHPKTHKSGCVDLEVVYTPSVPGAKRWAEFIQEIAPSIWLEISNVVTVGKTK